MSEPSPPGGGEGYGARDDEGPLRHSSGGFNYESQTVREAMCEKCKVIKRKGKVMVICENPKHKQRQG